VIGSFSDLKALPAFLLLLLVPSAFPLQVETGTICVSPVPEPIDGRRGAGPQAVDCAPDKYSLKIDSRQPISWPLKESIKLTGLDLSARHRVVVLCDGKPRQSFTFRFSGKETKLCLFLNDLYWTVQLWPDKRTPWCKCKYAVTQGSLSGKD
jgi:hypothetical protein